MPRWRGTIFWVWEGGRHRISTYRQRDVHIYPYASGRWVRIYEYYYHIMWARPDRTVPRSVRTTVKHITHAPRSPYHLLLYTGGGRRKGVRGRLD
jgi:hypothetical protein